MITVDELSFETAVKASKVPVIVVFVTEWSVLSGAVAKRASELDPSKFTVLKVDVDKSPSLAVRFSIRYVPFLMKFLPTGELIASGKVLTDIVAA